MVRDLHDELERALQAQPAWRLDLDDIVGAAHRARRRRRGRQVVGSSAAALLATGAVLVGPGLLGELRGATGDVGVSTLRPAAAPSRPPAGSGTAASVDVPIAQERFSRAGYGYADAVLLARLWGKQLTPGQAKVRAGNDLAAGRSLPVPPGQTPQSVSDGVAMEAFFDNGYGYADAASLAKVWRHPASSGDLAPVKALAGRMILAGQALPI